MDGVLHELAERLVDHAMARDDGLAGKAGRDDGQAPVRLAARRGAGVPGVLRALVDELEAQRLERGEALADLPGDAQGLSSSTYFERRADWATMNRSISPMPPNSLKVAQVFSE